MVPTSLWKRFVTFIYDSLIAIALLMAATALSLVITGGVPIFPEDGLKFHLFQIYLGLVIISYFVFFWSYGGQTVGMRAWKVRLIDITTHKPPRFKIALLRCILALSNLVLGGIGFLPALWREDKATVYDLLTKTRLGCKA